MVEHHDTEVTGRLKAGRKGFILEDAKGVRWRLKIDCDVRDLLGQRITVTGQASALSVDVRAYVVAKPFTG